MSDLTWLQTQSYGILGAIPSNRNPQEFAGTNQIYRSVGGIYFQGYMDVVPITFQWASIHLMPNENVMLDLGSSLAKLPF